MLRGDSVSKVDTINSIMERAIIQFEPYIRYIRFPHYKQLFDGERIDFNFPLTVLVGANGCNKSSVLRALYGCPGGNNTGVFWFTTDVDIINENSGRHCSIHGYWSYNTNEIVESLKTRIHKKTNPDYWEPSRPIVGYGMNPMSPLAENDSNPDRTATRWKAITKNVIFLDFRSIIGAYDKYFWHGDLTRTQTLRTKQDHIRHKAKLLRTVIDKNLSTFHYYNKEKISKNVLLSPDACREVSNIIGQDYEAVRLIEHSFYGGQLAQSVILKRVGLEYSEAFAGSGETSIVVLVHAIMSASEKSLILLDEPETSIHPKAQQRLQEFLLQQIITRKHQIVISTHSPTIINNLPPEAVKVMYIDPTDNKIRILPRSFPEEAFEVIGSTDAHKLKVYVEDALAKVIIDVYINRFMIHLGNSIDVEVIPGGAGTIMRNFVSGSAVRIEDNVVYLFDGDQKMQNRTVIDQEMRDKFAIYHTGDYKIDVTLIPEAENNILDKMVKELVGSDILLFLNGNPDTGGNEEQKYMQLRNFLSYWSNYVFYLPGMQPEELLYSSLEVVDREAIFGNLETSGINWKKYFVGKVKRDLCKPNPKSEDILSIQRQIVARFPEHCETFDLIMQIITNHFTH
jgi:predicted ATPase